MIIQHNIMALNAHRQLGGNTGMVSKNLEKLSSGYKINRAGDDAAGLAISEKMRAQIKGLDRAKLNAQDGISLVQTAEGALTETHSMLNRLVELATQAANGIYQASDRQKITDEVNSLKGEIDRISQATNFNGIALLDGSQGSNVKVTTNVPAGPQAATAATVTMDLSQLAADYGTAGWDNLTSISIGGTAVNLTLLAADTDAQALEKIATAIGNTMAGFTASVSGNNLVFTSATTGSAIAQPNNISATWTASAAGASTGATGTWKAGTDAGTGNATTTIDVRKLPTAGGTLTIGDRTYEFVAAAGDVKAGNTAVVLGTNDTATTTALLAAITGNLPTGVAAANVAQDADGNIVITSVDTTPVTATGANVGGGLKMQVGETADEFNQVTVSIDDMSTEGLKIDDIDLSTQDAAAASLEKIKTAVETVSTARSGLGALQNRLEHTINNLGVTSENMTAAESRIRDVDMAKEMMDFTKNNVLTQAAQAMLSQANQQPQQVLQLLR